jgi:hypothetical protein
LLGSSAALLAVLVTPSSAAASRTLYFDNQGAPGTTSCTTNYVLVAKSTHGHPCGHTMAVASGTGYTYTDQYISTPGQTGFRLDSRRHVTGTVYLATYMYANVQTGNGGLLPDPPGVLGATVAVYANNVELGEGSATGVVTPEGTVAVKLDLPVPASLANATIKSVIAEVTYTSGVGVVSVSYAPTSASKLSFPTR